MWRRAFTLVALVVSLASSEDLVVRIPNVGGVRGVLKEDVVAFLGVPYAKPPVGELRWRPPVAFEPWSGTRNATTLGKSCINVESDWSEDCLFLNIYVPVAVHRGRATRVPVIAWIHGIDYLGSSPSEYPIENLVISSNMSAIVVSMGYRMNLFGFLGSYALLEREPSGTGSYGIADQQLALKWIQDHISAFGGDPIDVTIAGESAGGNSVLNHLVRKESFGLYNRAIIQSGTNNEEIPLDRAAYTYNVLMYGTGCADVKCMVQAPAGLLFSVWMKYFQVFQLLWGPVLDGVSLKKAPIELIRDRSYNTIVPVLIGSVRDEMAFFLRHSFGSGLPNQLDRKGLEKALRIAFPDGKVPTDKVLDLYRHGGSYPYPERLGDFSPEWWTAMRIATDVAQGHCQTRRLASALVKRGTPAVYVYSFAYPAQGFVSPASYPGTVLVPHSADVAFLFNTTGTNDKAEQELVRIMTGYWIQFARSGDPNGGGLVQWPKYDLDSDSNLRLDAPPQPVSVQHFLRKEACDFWDSYWNGGGGLAASRLETWDMTVQLDEGGAKEEVQDVAADRDLDISFGHPVLILGIVGSIAMSLAYVSSWPRTYRCYSDSHPERPPRPRQAEGYSAV